MEPIIAGYMSVPYRSGGTGKLGLDCSGLAYVVYRDYDGTRLPITVSRLFRLENRVEYDELAYGDLVFFKVNKRKVSHVGIYVGDGQFVHTSRSRGVVVDSLTDEYWAERYAGARRVY
jgi:cell wall-associated NlpC family hydrolase